MGSVRFDDGDESQLSSSNIEKNASSEKLLHEGGLVNYALVPTKQRSATERRAHRFITLPWRISRKRSRVSNGVKKISENTSKNSELKRKRRRITKDEKEVAETLNSLAGLFSVAANTSKPVLDGEPSQVTSSAETLNSLADMFPDAANTNKRVLDVEPSKITSSTTVGAENSTAAAEDSAAVKVKDSGEINTRVTVEGTNHSSANVENFRRSMYDRPNMSESNMIQGCDRMIPRDQVSASKIQYSIHYHSKEDKGLLILTGSSSAEVLSSETRISLLGFPTLSESTCHARQPSVNDNSSIADKINYPQVVLQPKRLWKRCSTHVHIARLINGFQESEGPTHRTASGAVRQGLQTSIDKQERRINHSYRLLPINGHRHSVSDELADVAITNISLTSLHQNQHQYSTLQRGSQFLSLATGDGIGRSNYHLEALRRFHSSYELAQNLAATHFSPSQNRYSAFGGHSFSEAAPQVQPVSCYNLESQQQRWGQQIRAQYNPSGSMIEQPDWQNRARDPSSMFSYARAHYTHLHPTLVSMYHHLSPTQLETHNIRF